MVQMRKQDDEFELDLVFHLFVSDVYSERVKFLHDVVISFCPIKESGYLSFILVSGRSQPLMCDNMQD